MANHRLFGPLAAVFVAALLAATTLTAFAAVPAQAVPPKGGPVVLDGMDPTDHDDCSSPGTGDYIKQSFTGIAPHVRVPNDAWIAVLGSASTRPVCGGEDLATRMTFYLSGVTGLNATPAIYYPDATAIDSFFTGLSSGTLKPMIIWYTDETGPETRAAFAAHATAIAAFPASGGGLFTNENGYAWLTALLPGATYTEGGSSQGPEATALGFTDFGFTNAIVASIWHGHFAGDTGDLKPLTDYPFPDPTSPRVAVSIGGAKVNVGPSPSPSPGPQKQTAKCAKPGQPVAANGVTPLFKTKKCMTDAGQRVKVRVICTSKRASARGEMRLCRLVAGRYLRTYGVTPLKVKLIYSASATAGFERFRKVRDYNVK